MYPLPSNIHFITMGDMLTDSESKNFIDWASKNRGFTATLWTEGDKVDVTCKFLEFTLSCDPEISGVRVVKAARGGDIQWQKQGQRFTAHIRLFEDVPALDSRRFFYDFLKTEQRDRVVRDLGSLEVLHHFGGIFVDKTLPAPSGRISRGLLLHRAVAFSMCDDGSRRLTNRLIAAKNGTRQLRALAKTFRFAYQTVFTKIPDEPPLPPEPEQETPEQQLARQQNIDLFTDTAGRLADNQRFRIKKYQPQYEVLGNAPDDVVPPPFTDEDSENILRGWIVLEEKSPAYATGCSPTTPMQASYNPNYERIIGRRARGESDELVRVEGALPHWRTTLEKKFVFPTYYAETVDYEMFSFQHVTGLRLAIR